MSIYNFDYSDDSMDVIFDSGDPAYGCPFIGYDKFAFVYFTITVTHCDSHCQPEEHEYQSYTKEALLRRLNTEISDINDYCRCVKQNFIERQKQEKTNETHFDDSYCQKKITGYLQGIRAVLEYSLLIDVPKYSGIATAGLTRSRAPGGEWLSGSWSTTVPYQARIISYGARERKQITQADKIIRRGDFSGLIDFSHLEIPDSVVQIEAGSFMECSELETIHLPRNIRSIGESTFELCTSLMKIYIPDSAYQISNRAFMSCTALVAIRFPKDIKRINESALIGCKSLRFAFLSSEDMYSSAQNEKIWRLCYSEKITLCLVGPENDVRAAKVVDFRERTPQMTLIDQSTMLMELSEQYNCLFQRDIESYSDKQSVMRDDLGKSSSLNSQQ